MGILDFIPLIGNVLDRVIPDPEKSAEAKLKMMQLVQNGELEALHADVQLATGQMDINKVEAANSNLFVSGWRPAIGWICAGAMAFKFMGGPAASVISQWMGHPIVLPTFDFTEMSTILLGMLGLGTLRTYEKVKGAA